MSSCGQEYIQFRYSKLYMYNYKLDLKLIPKKKRTKVILSYYDTLFETTRIPQKPSIFRVIKNKKTKITGSNTIENYQNVITSFMKIDESLIKYPKDVFDTNGNVIGVTFVSGMLRV